MQESKTFSLYALAQKPQTNGPPFKPFGDEAGRDKLHSGGVSVPEGPTHNLPLRHAVLTTAPMWRPNKEIKTNNLT